MAFDGFLAEHKTPFAAQSVSSHGLYVALERLADRVEVEVEGIEHLPAGGAVLVANHAFGFWDIALAVARIRARTGRAVWSLGEHAWWRVPIVRRLASMLGVVDGTPANADDLLLRGELVLVLPGGLREAMKPHELRYRLLWGHRYGFVRAALRNRVPLVPMACLGGDEMFDLVGDAFARGRRLHLPLPLPRLAHVAPHLSPLRFFIGEPIAPRGSADDEGAVRSIRREVEGALHEMLEDELAHRAGFDG